jgi:hypothetical protein
MKSKLSGTLLIVALIAGIGCAYAAGGAGGVDGRDGMRGGDGIVMGTGPAAPDSGASSGSQSGTTRPGVDRKSDRPSEQNKGETGRSGPLSCH